MVAELFASIVSKCCLISYVHEFRIRRILDHFSQWYQPFQHLFLFRFPEEHCYNRFTLKRGREWVKLILELLKEFQIVELN